MLKLPLTCTCFSAQLMRKTITSPIKIFTNFGGENLISFGSKKNKENGVKFVQPENLKNHVCD